MKVEIDLPEIWVKQFKSLAAILQRADWKQELSWYLEWDGCNLLADPGDLAEHAMHLLSDICPLGHPGDTILPRVIARRCHAYFARKKHTPRQFETEESLVRIWRVAVGLESERIEKISQNPNADELNAPNEGPLGLDPRSTRALRWWVLNSWESENLPEGHKAELIPLASGEASKK